MRDLGSFTGVIGVAVSSDGGATWQHVGTALQEHRRSFSAPFVVYDKTTGLYVMLPDVRPASSWLGAPPARMQAYTTTAAEFPFGWRRTDWHDHFHRHHHHHHHHHHDRNYQDHGDSNNQQRGPDIDRAWEVKEGLGPVVRSGQPNRRLGTASNGDVGAGSFNGLDSHLHGDGSVPRAQGLPRLPHGQHLRGVVATQHEGTWWVFATHVQPSLLPWLPALHTPLIYTADAEQPGSGGLLSSPWRLHPASARPPDGWAACLARRLRLGAAGRGRPAWPSAGRPFVWGGALHRWVRPCGGKGERPCEDAAAGGGEQLVLLRAAAANATHFVEEEAARYQAPGGRSWSAKRLGHADVRPLPVSEGAEGASEVRWWGLVSGDRYADGMHHFLVIESWFVELKTQLRNLVAAQLLLVLTALALQTSAAWRPEDLVPRKPTSGGDAEDGYDGGGGGKGGSGGGTGGGSSCRTLAALLRQPPPVAALGVLDLIARHAHAGVLRAAATWEAAEGWVRRVAAQPRVQFCAHALGACLLCYVVALSTMAAAPSAVPCPRWPVVVRPFAESPHYVPPQPFVDPAGPYDVSNLTIITGGTHSFYDRLENLVGSLQYWEPNLPIVVYDLGLTSAQLAAIRCWRGVRVERFPYEDYPPAVHEASSYAWKALTFEHALRRNPVMLWLDSGLEVRASLDSLRATLSRHGHVSAQQSMAPSDFPYTEKYEVPFFKLKPEEYARIKDLPFCAAGVQGFVAGAASDRLVLGPAVACSLDVNNCMAPPGHSRANHLYEQTALTLQLRLHNFSSCLPRETHCSSAVKKVAWDPEASSDPVVLASRRHRWPKPYRQRVASQPGCVADPAGNPWRSVSSEHPETVTKSSSLLFRLGFVYGQALGDLLIQAGCCLGFHFFANSLLAIALLAGEACRYWASRNAQAAGPQTPPSAGGAAGWPGLWLLRAAPLLAGLGLMLALLPASLMTACRAI